jgi:hypothetical protein
MAGKPGHREAARETAAGNCNYKHENTKGTKTRKEVEWINPARVFEQPALTH